LKGIPRIDSDCEELEKDDASPQKKTDKESGFGFEEIHDEKEGEGYTEHLPCPIAQKDIIDVSMIQVD